ncbi:prolyl 4-hydroxylase subunit alpha-2-like isoform X2 [Drosophila albomicans]|uniref:procollagen-proline 4-dioxygenase n=1 Tax=Drosophila albomicans TaxID=7291 RepID=A0A6P8XYW6_DROAB|nr:prolyl 4-hydroxylase subunit alpha-2-like isoform X2 [Drosophila albomicans]
MLLAEWKFQLLAMALLLGMVSGQEDNEKSHSTSIAGMVELLKLEDQLVENLSQYADELEQKLRTVRGFVTGMRKENQLALNQTEHYLANPLNAFSLIRRMQQDWTHWQYYMQQEVGLKQLNFVKEMQQLLPTSTDLEEAAASIYRIHSTYDMKVSDIVKGLLNGKQYAVSLNALDSYAMGKYLYDQQNFGYACQWIFQAIEWLKNGKHKLPLPLALDLSEVSRLYAESLIQMNRYADALNVINSALSLKTDKVKLLLRKSEVEHLIRTHPNIAPKPQFVKQVVGAYEHGCRGHFPVRSQLHCVYNSTNSPFLRLAPLKMELVGLDPYMVLYHDVISDKEISELQSLAVPSLKRATVFQQATGRNTVVKTRTSKVTWLADGFNNLTGVLNRRVMDMTGFNVVGSEMLQVMNYGLGGHYDKHYDYFNSSLATNLTKMNGDRIATVLFYLTDVEQGGATVFPNIQKAVFPTKGAAIIWYNLKHDGEGDQRTLHAACPVIVGSKWVCNKWVRERQQAFRRPCLTTQ